MGLVTIWYNPRFDRLVQCENSMFHAIMCELGYAFIGVL